jgi:phage portal protein BeeE
VLMSNGAFAPTTFGDRMPNYGGQQYYYSSAGINLTNAFASYGAVYRSQVWIATLVNKIAYGTARLPLKVYNRLPDGSREEARDSTFAQLLRNPNPRHDPFFFWLWTVSTMEVYGEAMWVKIREPGRAPTQLWPLHPANVITRRNDQGILMYRFMYAQGEKYLEWTADDIVHFKSYNPDDQVRGMSRLEPLRQTILNEDSSRRAAAAMWSNGGRPSFALTSRRACLRRRWTASSERQGPASGRRQLGQDRDPRRGSDADTAAVERGRHAVHRGRKISREEACGMYDVPPPVVQILTGRRSPTSPSRCVRCTATRWRPDWACSSPRSTRSSAPTSIRRATSTPSS